MNSKNPKIVLALISVTLRLAPSIDVHSSIIHFQRAIFNTPRFQYSSTINLKQWKLLKHIVTIIFNECRILQNSTYVSASMERLNVPVYLFYQNDLLSAQ